MLIGSSVAQYELFIRCMHFNTLRKISSLNFYNLTVNLENVW